VTSPENRPINGSPWFAFRVRATTAKAISIRVSCDGTRLRYIPKISVDGARWITLPAEAFTLGPKNDEGTLRVDVGPEPLWIAAQEIISGDVLESWSRSLERLPFVTRAEIGRSVGGRPLYLLEINATPANASAKPGYVVVVSRQHPPETTGSQALMRFIETVVADSPLARDFRQRFAVLLVPLVNPDGVEAGHWRHNLNGVDTNRDWDAFAQPETRAVRDAVLAARERGRLMFHLDFHSTFNDVFYTQTDEAPSNPAGFTKAWLEGISQRVPSYKVNRSANATPTQATSHHWAHRVFGIPSVTYELGDNTDRVVLQSVATAAAESMIELLLAAK
jgi:cytosolic carboxypeptidase protein 6